MSSAAIELRRALGCALQQAHHELPPLLRARHVVHAFVHRSRSSGSGTARKSPANIASSPATRPAASASVSACCGPPRSLVAGAAEDACHDAPDSVLGAAHPEVERESFVAGEPGCCRPRPRTPRPGGSCRCRPRRAPARSGRRAPRGMPRTAHGTGAARPIVRSAACAAPVHRPACSPSRRQTPTGRSNPLTLTSPIDSAMHSLRRFDEPRRTG